jgi:glycosyltransferase involved in cell wall biosynthesis
MKSKSLAARSAPDRMDLPITRPSENPGIKVPVLMIGSFLSASVGIPTVSEHLSLKLRNAGWQIITASQKSPKVPRLLDMLSTAWNQREQYQIALVDVYSGAAFVWAEAVCWILRRARKPYILNLHGGNLPVFAASNEKRVRRVLDYATAVVAPSPYLIENMRDYRADIQCMPNSLDIDSYRFRHRSHIRPELIWLRAFHKIYNPEMAIRTLALIRSEVDHAHLIMIGPDKGDGTLKSAQLVRKELGLQERISIVGGISKSDVAKWLNQGDIFLNSTNVDNTPVSVLEAMACGLCVISTKVGGIPYLLENERNALLVPPGDERAMAEGVLRILREPGLAGQLSKNARLKAETYDYSRIIPKWEELFRRAASISDPR